MVKVQDDRLQTLTPYVQGKSEISGLDRIIKLSSNESPLGPSPKAIAAYHDVSETLFRYPDGSQHDLCQAVGATHGLPTDQIICGNGSDELISLLMRARLRPGDEVVVSENSFVMAKIHAISQGADVVIAPELNLRPDADAMLAAITAKTRFVVFASPNNPVGDYIARPDIERLVKAVPKDVIVLIDSAYGDYVVADDYDAGETFVARHENVVMTRTFSKLYGLAGLRIGWIYASKTIVADIHKIRTPFNANAAAMAAATAAVKDAKYTKFVRDYNNHWLEFMITNLRKLGLTVAPSVANFYLILFDDSSVVDAAHAEQYLLSKGIIPRATSAGGPSNALRITVGLESDNLAVLDALMTMLEEA